MLNYLYRDDVCQMDFSWHLFFSLWIYDSIKVACCTVYFCVELFGSLLSILKRWGRSDAFGSPVKEPGSLEISHPLQMGNEKESRLPMLSCPHQLLSKSVIRLKKFSFETSVTSTDNQSTQFWGVAQVQKDKSSVVCFLWQLNSPFHCSVMSIVSREVHS